MKPKGKSEITALELQDMKRECQTRNGYIDAIKASALGHVATSLDLETLSNQTLQELAQKITTPQNLLTAQNILIWRNRMRERR